jgi:ABC-type multidrug transport system fused ATPase/permease subunit
VECNKLPVNISKILPKALTNSLGGQIGDLHRLDSILAKVSPDYIRDSFIFGFAMAVIMAVIFFCSTFGLLFLEDLMLLLILRLVIGLICCVSFLLPTIIISILYLKSKKLPSEIKVKMGDVGGYCWGTFFSAAFMTFLTAFAHAFI